MYSNRSPSSSRCKLSMGTKGIVLHWANVIYDKGITQTLKTNILNPFQEPRVSVFLFFSLISINYQLLWCCSFVSNCYLKIQFQWKDTFWEGNAFSSQYICLHWIRKKKLYLKNTPFLFYKNPFYKNHEAQNRMLGFDLTAQGSLAWTPHAFLWDYVSKNTKRHKEECRWK